MSGRLAEERLHACPGIRFDADEATRSSVAGGAVEIGAETDGLFTEEIRITLVQRQAHCRKRRSVTERHQRAVELWVCWLQR